MRKIFIFLLVTTYIFAKETLKFESYINDKKEIVIKVVKDTSPNISNSIEMAQPTENGEDKENISNTASNITGTESNQKTKI